MSRADVETGTDLEKGTGLEKKRVRNLLLILAASPFLLLRQSPVTSYKPTGR